MSRIPYVIDNDRHKLADVLNQVLETHRDLAMHVATAFFNIRDYAFLRERLRDLGSLRLLLGAEPRSGKAWASNRGLPPCRPPSAAIWQPSRTGQRRFWWSRT